MKIVVFTLGCKVNKYESDSLVYSLNLLGHDVSCELVVADIYILNTCAVTGEAEKKSRQLLAKCRKLNPNCRILVMGCASQNNPTSFKGSNVKFVSGTAKKIQILEFLDKEGVRIAPLPHIYEDTMVAKASRTRAYIKIQDGCDRFCTYCLIPHLRGRSRSREMISIINEVNMLSDEVKEIVLTGIDITDYKIDGEKSLPLLLETLDSFGKRLRIGSIEESVISDDFLKRMSNLKNFCPHFHLSLQSGSSDVLKKMNRHYTAEEFLSTCKKIYSYFKNASITTDIIVGFPTETEGNFKETYFLAKKVKFLHMHIFPYSKRDGTPASKLRDLEGSIKKQRVKALEKLDLKLHKKFIKKHKYGTVLVEDKIDDYFIGHTENFVKCYIASDSDITNELVKVKILKMYQDGAIAKIIK